MRIVRDALPDRICRRYGAYLKENCPRLTLLNGLIIPLTLSFDSLSIGGSYPYSIGIKYGC